MIHIGIDVGGTFTDFVLMSTETGTIEVKKVPTRPSDLAGAVLEGLSGVDLGQVASIVHGTTVAINAVLQRLGAPTAIITTAGFRDHIEIGDTRRYTGGLFDHKWVRSKPYPVPHANRFEVQERITADGTVETSPDTAELDAIADAIAAMGIRSVAICFLNSYVNSANEKQAGDYLASRLPNVHITLSSTNPEFREYPRFITAVFNASISPLLKEYVTNLGRALREEGFEKQVLYMTSSGGLITEEKVIAEPLRLLVGGIAGGVSASAYMAKQVSAPNVATFDMGGTSSDVGFIKDYRMPVSPNAVIDAFPIALPDLDVKVIGAGGGSIAWLTPEGLIKVGPMSASAVPGPACYNTGGTELTVTDANLILGRLGEASLLGGGMTLDKSLSIKAAERLAEASGISDIYELASGVIDICVTNMYGAIREVSVERGENPEEMSLFAFGGAGGLHAMLIADRLGMSKVLIPRDAGNFSAFGMLVSDRRYDFVNSYNRGFVDANIADIKGRLSQMGDNGRQQLINDGLDKGLISILYKVGMRYQGQIFEEELIFTDLNFSLEDLGERFSELYQQKYDFSRDAKLSEIVNLRVVATGRTGHTQVERARSGTSSRNPAPITHRPVYLDGRFADTPVYERRQFSSGTQITGPAIIEEYDSTIVLPNNWQLSVDDHYNIVGERIPTTGLDCRLEQENATC